MNGGEKGTNEPEAAVAVIAEIGRKDIKCGLCRECACSMPWGGNVCSSCGSISASHLPTLDELAHFYNQFNKTYRGGSKTPNQQARYARAYLNIVNKLKTQGTLIDVGSSTNPFPHFAMKTGYQVTVLDYVHPVGLSPEIQFVKGNLNENDIVTTVGKKFDIVCAFAVLEHCRTPILAVRLLSELCAPNGYVVITTPEIGCYSDRNALGRSGWFHPPDHLYLISRKAMVSAFYTNGCKLVSKSKFELNGLRWFARYGMGFVEGVIGSVAKRINHQYWMSARERNKSKYKGIALFVFRKIYDNGNDVICAL